MKLQKGMWVRVVGASGVNVWCVISTNSRKKPGRPIELRRRADGYNGVKVYRTFTNESEMDAANAVIIKEANVS